MAVRDNFFDANAIWPIRIIIGGIAIFWTECLILLLRLILTASMIHFPQLIQNVVMDTLLMSLFNRKYQRNKFECKCIFILAHDFNC